MAVLRRARLAARPAFRRSPRAPSAAAPDPPGAVPTLTARCRTPAPRARRRDATRRPTLLLLDGHSLAYRAFYALREVEMSTTTGQPTNAVFGFTSMLINLMRDEEPTHIAVAFDVSRKTFRSEAYAEYKAGRSETPEDFRGQVTLIREVLDALRIPIADGRGLRGRRRHRHPHHARPTARACDVLICTGDRDALQLVDRRTSPCCTRAAASAT